MRHAHSMSLSSEQVTKIQDLTREIMREEGVNIPLVIKPKVWKTAYFRKMRRVRYRLGELTLVLDERIQLGGRMLTGYSYPSKIYYISIYDPSYSISSISNPREVMLATIVASTILEEIAHAKAHRTYGIKPHGTEFLSAFKDLWKKHFIMFLFKLQGIYGYEGLSGEDYFD